MAEPQAIIRLKHIEGYRFEVDYGDAGNTRLLTDEPAPLGEGQGPGAGRILGSAIANCLMASLVFCMDKRGAEVAALDGVVTVNTGRNAQGRVRIQKVDVELHADVAEEHAEAFEKCRRVFEQFCTITESVKDGIEVETTFA